MSDRPAEVCHDHERRARIVASGGAHNGVAAVEIVPKPADDPLSQRVLAVHFFHGVPPGIDGSLIRIEGGARIPGSSLRVGDVRTRNGRLEITLARFGDFSDYLLTIDHPALDPLFRSRTFRFKDACRDPFDCREPLPRSAPLPPDPTIDYQAKDYRSFRRALLDFLRVRVPGYEETNEADLGVMLAELFAYVGDQLSYFQDAAANERYLHTARHRRSAKRHARLVDYSMHEAIAARTWLRLEAGDALAAETPVPVPAGAAVRTPDDDPDRAVWFATDEPAVAFAEQNEMQIHTWQNAKCCLPRGACSVDLTGRKTTLAPGRTLLVEEVSGATTVGSAAGAADRSRRQVVRVTSVEFLHDPLQPTDAGNPDAQAVTRVRWSSDDALRHDFCLDRTSDDRHLATVVRGNLVRASHGRRRGPERFVWQADVRRELSLEFGPLAWERRRSADLSTITLTVDGQAWEERESLLDSTASSTHFVVETDADERGVIRFGDQASGSTPRHGATIEATYRVGGGGLGNVGADTLTRGVDLPAEIVAVTNPLPGAGGLDPESIVDVRRDAPEAFRQRPLRAVTNDDYRRTAAETPGVSGAAAEIRWTGSWWTVFSAIDPLDRGELIGRLREAVTRRLATRRQAGYDLETSPPRYVPLEIELMICVAPDHFPGDVLRAAHDLLGAGRRTDGEPGFFHPDRFTFGQPLYLSRLYAAVMSVTGVRAAHAVVFKRLHEAARGELARGVIDAGPGEVLRLDHDRNFPDHGVLRLVAEGGK